VSADELAKRLEAAKSRTDPQPLALLLGHAPADPICSLRRDRVSLDHVWAWSLEHVGESPFRTAITQVESDN